MRIIDQIKIAFFDVDGTVHQGPTLWEVIHKLNSTWDTLGLKYLEQFKTGKIGFQEFAEQDVAAWENLDVNIVYKAIEQCPIESEVISLFKMLQERSILIYLVSNGISQFAERITNVYNLDGYYANDLLVENGRLTGKMQFNVPFDAKDKVVKEVLSKHRLIPEQALAIGDSSNDLPMFSAVEYPILVESDLGTTDYQGCFAKSWNEVNAYLGLKIDAC